MLDKVSSPQLQYVQSESSKGAKEPLKKSEPHSSRFPVPLRCKSSQKQSRGKVDFVQRFQVYISLIPYGKRLYKMRHKVENLFS